MANRRFTQFFNTLHTKPVLLDCNFVIDAANGNGLGQRSLKGPGIAQVFAHTSFGTPAVFNGVTNRVPAGFLQIFLSDNYNRYFGGFSGFVSPVSGTPILVTTGTTQGLVYIIVSVGTTTLDQWQKLGLPIGITPAVGVAFVAKATTTATGTGVIEVPAAAGAGVDEIEVIGDPNLTIVSSVASGLPAANPYIIVRCMANLAVAQPADGAVAGLSFYMSSSSILIDGE